MAISVKFIKNTTSAQIAVTAGVGDTGKLQIQFNGADIYNNLSGSFNDISAGAYGVTQPISLPLDSSGNIPKGVYYVNFVASAGVSDTSTVNFTLDQLLPCLESTYDCYTPNFLVQDKTGYSNFGGTVASASRSLNLTYPTGSAASPVLVTVADVTSNLYIDTNVVWTGAMQSTMSYDVTYTIAAIASYDSYTYQQIGVAYDVELVECDNSLCDIYCCIEGLRKKVVAAQSKNRSYYAELLSEYTYVGSLVTQYKEAVSCKKYEDLPKIYEQIKLVSGCEECDCGCDSEDTKQLLGIGGTSFVPVVNNYAQSLITQVRNASGGTMGAGTVVYLDGATGNLPKIVKAQANSEATSTGTYGVVLTSISNNSTGYVVVMGLVPNIDTSAFNEGDILWLSPSVAGGYTTTKPVAPNHAVYVAIVTRASNQGSIEVKIQNGYELEELHNVLITSAANGDILVYDSATQLWKNTKTLNGTYNFTNLSATSLSAATATFGTISVDSPTLSVDAANDRVGFGTDTPAYKNDFAVEARFGAQVRDELGGAGNNLDILTSTGSKVRWRSRSDLSIPSTTSPVTNRVAFFSDGPNNIIRAASGFITDATGSLFSIGSTALPTGATYSLAVHNTSSAAASILLTGQFPIVRFRNTSYLDNSHYSFTSGVAITGGAPGDFSLIRTVAGSAGPLFDFNATTGLFKFYTQFEATTIATNSSSYWQLGRHLVGSVTPNGNYIEVSINGVAYKLVTAS
jgi:hypothetical protein